MKETNSTPRFALQQRITKPSAQFRKLCDAALDLDVEAVMGHVPEDPVECLYLLSLADAAAVRECAEVANKTSKVPPSQIFEVILEHQERLSRYVYFRAAILDVCVDENFYLCHSSDENSVPSLPPAEDSIWPAP